jgi:hypothetical protein
MSAIARLFVRLYIAQLHSFSLHSGTIFEILKPHTNFSAAYNSRQRELEDAHGCADGTRVEVRKQLRHWFEAHDGPSACWLTAPVGAGKSAIAYSMAEEWDMETRLVMSHFCSRKHPTRNDLSKFFSTFASNLARIFPSIIPALLRVIADARIFELSLETQCIELIVGPLKSVDGLAPPYVVVMDGLDECDSYSSLASTIMILLTALSSVGLKFLFVGRPDDHLSGIFDCFDERTVRTMDLRSFDVGTEIRDRAQNLLSQIRRKHSLPEWWPTDRDLDALSMKADGYYLYVETVASFIGERHADPISRLQRALQTHDGGFNALFKQIFDDAAKRDDCIIASRCMSIFVAAMEELSIDNIAKTLEIDCHVLVHALRGYLSVLDVPRYEQDGEYLASITAVHWMGIR